MKKSEYFRDHDEVDFEARVQTDLEGDGTKQFIICCIFNAVPWTRSFNISSSSLARGPHGGRLLLPWSSRRSRGGGVGTHCPHICHGAVGPV